MRKAVSLTLFALLAAAPAIAQTPGVPVMNGSFARGASVAGMAGFGVGDAEGTGLGASGTLGLRRMAFTGMVSRVTGATEDAFYGAGGAVTVKVAGGPLVPLSLNLQAGAARWKTTSPAPGNDIETWHIPVGLGISWVIPQPVVALRPWLAPRLDLARVSVASTPASTDSNFGLSGGLSFGFLNGMSVDLAFDRVFGGDSSGNPTILGVGLSWNLR